MMDYLQNQLYNTFSFDNEVLEDANIVTFGRAKNNKSYYVFDSSKNTPDLEKKVFKLIIENLK